VVSTRTGVGGAGRSGESARFVLVAPLLVGEHFVDRDLDPFSRQLRVPPLRRAASDA